MASSKTLDVLGVLKRIEDRGRHETVHRVRSDVAMSSALSWWPRAIHPFSQPDAEGAHHLGVADGACATQWLARSRHFDG